MSSYRRPTNLQRSIIQGIVGIAVLTLAIGGCAGGGKLAHGGKGNVYLENVTDWSFEASHPAVIDQLTMAKIVKGVYGNEALGGSSGMSAGGGKPMRIFSDEDAEFLSPLLAQSLSKAKPEQLVGFRVSSSAGSGSEPTTGSIYVRNGSVYLTIGQGAKPTGFTPEFAARTEPAPAYAAGGAVGATAMIIDYHALATEPMSASLPTAPLQAAAPVKTRMAADSAGQETGQSELAVQKLGDLGKVKEVLARKDSEITMLRKEAEWMKRELKERDEEIKAIKSMKVSAKPAQKKKTAQATPTR